MSVLARRADFSEFVGGHRGMLLRIVAKPGQPGRCPEQADHAEHIERNLPRKSAEQRAEDQRSERATDAAGARIDLATAESLSRGLIGNGKHKLVWRGLKGQIAKDKAKLLLNLVAVAPTAVPRGGEIDVAINGSLASPSFVVRCRGVSARPPQYLGEFIQGPPPPINALTIQAYYTLRLAASSRMRLDIAKDGPDVLLRAKPLGRAE